MYERLRERNCNDRNDRSNLEQHSMANKHEVQRVAVMMRTSLGHSRSRMQLTLYHEHGKAQNVVLIFSIANRTPPSIVLVILLYSNLTRSIASYRFHLSFMTNSS